jgi:hypothetical protein
MKTLTEDKELNEPDVHLLTREGYYSIVCDVCWKPMGFIRVLNGFDYTYDESLCFDCAHAKMKQMRHDQNTGIG